MPQTATVCANISTVRFHNITRDGQTKPQTIVSTDLNWSAPKTIEDARQKLLANAMAGVDNGDLQSIVSLRTAELDTTAGWCELEPFYRGFVNTCCRQTASPTIASSKLSITARKLMFFAFACDVIVSTAA